MNEPRYIQVEVSEYPDKLVDAALQLLNLLRDLERRVESLERELSLSQGYQP